MAEDGSVIIKVRFETGDVDQGVDAIREGCKRAGTAASRLQQAASRAWDMRGAQTAQRRMASLARTAGEMEKTAEGTALAGMDRALQDVERTAEAAADGLDGAGVMLAGLTAGMAGGYTGALRYGLGVQALTALLAALGGTLRDGMTALARYDGETAAALGSLRSSLGSVQGALITAFAPITTAVAPYLSSLCNMLVTAANYVAMFFAVLGGKNTYKRAVSGAQSYAAGISAAGSAVRVATVQTDQFGRSAATAVSAAGRAATIAADGIAGVGRAVKDAKNNLSGLDELNLWRVEEQTSGGGGGGSSPGGSVGGGGGLDIDEDFAFEEVPVDDAFAERIDWIKEHFDGLLTTAEAIGAAVLAWKVARAFGAGLKTSLGLAVAVGGAVAAVKGYLDAWKKGIDLSSMRKMLVGLAAAIAGVALAAGPVGGAFTALAGGAALAAIACREWVKTGKLSDGALKTLTAGLVLAGGALSLLSGSWVPLAIAAVAALAAAVAARWNEIKAKTSAVWSSVKSGVLAVWNEMKRSVSEKAQAIRNAAVTAFNTIRERIQAAVRAASETVYDRFEAMRSTVAEKVAGARDTVYGVFSDIYNGIRQKVDAAASAVRSAIDTIRSCFNFSWSLPKLKLPHISISGSFSLVPPRVPKFSVSWYARGGIVDGATLIGAGEAGREAIIPLERHTQWLDEVAKRLAERLDGAGRIPGLAETAERLGDLAASIDRLGLSISSFRQPVLASGTVIPPRAVYAAQREDALAGGAGLRQLLAGLAAAGGTGSTGSGNASYTFIAQLDGRELFRQTISQGKMRQLQTGQNPFDLR